MPAAIAAWIADVLMLVVGTEASVGPPCERTYRIAISPGFSRAPEIMAAIVAHHELPDGYSFQLDPTRVSLLETAEWVGRERKCCPFFDFQVALDGPGEGRLTLTLTGRPGVKEFILEEFRGLPPAAIC